jgi:hypothetical protein
LDDEKYALLKEDFEALMNLTDEVDASLTIAGSNGRHLPPAIRAYATEANQRLQAALLDTVANCEGGLDKVAEAVNSASEAFLYLIFSVGREHAL